MCEPEKIDDPEIYEIAGQLTQRTRGSQRSFNKIIMIDELKKYKMGHFFFMPGDNLMQKCNAPTDRSGIYIVYALEKGRIELVYIGRSGKRGKDGRIQTRIAGCGGLKDRIVNGKHFNGSARRTSWPLQMLLENIEALDVYWYVTYDKVNHDFPEEVENFIKQYHVSMYGRLPRWNKRIKPMTS